MAANFEQLWNNALRQQQHRLKGHKYAGVLNELKYDNFLGTLNQLKAQYNDRLVTKCVDKLRPAFEQLNVFEKAIASAVQARADPCALIWGALQVVLAVRTSLAIHPCPRN